METASFALFFVGMIAFTGWYWYGAGYRDGERARKFEEWRERHCTPAKVD